MSLLVTCYFWFTLFPETCAISRAPTDTHASKFTCAVYRAHKITVFLPFVLLILYISVWKIFLSKNFSLKIIYRRFKTIYCKIKILQKKYIVPQIDHYLSLLDADILLRSHFQKQCICSRPAWVSWLMHRFLTLHNTLRVEPHCQLSSLLVHWSYWERNSHAILLKYEYVRRQMHRESSLQWLQLQAEEHFWSFISRCQVKHILPF